MPNKKINLPNNTDPKIMINLPDKKINLRINTDPTNNQNILIYLQNILIQVNSAK